MPGASGVGRCRCWSAATWAATPRPPSSPTWGRSPCAGAKRPGAGRLGAGGCSRSGRGRWAVVEQYLAEVLPLYGAAHGGLWPTERGGRVDGCNIDATFARLRTEVGLPAELGPHCLRHSYVTHLLEDGWDPLFVQQQVGHTWASTTAVYTGVSSDYKNQVLRQKLDAMLATEG